MKKLIFLSLALVLSTCDEKKEPILEAPPKINYNTEMEGLRYLKEVEWPKAYREQDTILLDRILGDDFQMVRDDGVWSNKKKEMNWIRNNAMSHDSFRYEIKRLEILENGTAIIAGTGHIINDDLETTYESSNILIKRNGIWKAVLSHVSGVTEQN